MMPLFEQVVAIVALLFAFPSFVRAANPASSSFYFAETQTQFSLNVPNDTSSKDVYFLFSSPAYSWVAVGFGAEMKNSLMLIMYLSSNGNNVTISPRIADGNSEPSVTSDVQIETLPGTGVNDDEMTVAAVCHNCRVWAGGFLDEKNSAQPMIYAFGPGYPMQSNALDAPMRRHARYGQFTMNMVQATGSSGVPANATALNGVELLGGVHKDRDSLNLAHTVFAALALFILWPLNVILAGFFKKIQIHVGVSVVIVIFLVLSYALGIADSSQYNRSKGFKDPHQIFAFLSIAPFLAMSILPIRPIANLAPIIPRLHTHITLLTFLILVITGGLGLRLALQSMPYILAYVAVALIVAAFIVGIQLCVKRRGSAHARANGTHPRNIEEEDTDVALAAYYATQKVDPNLSRGTSESSFNNQQGPPTYQNPPGYTYPAPYSNNVTYNEPAPPINTSTYNYPAPADNTASRGRSGSGNANNNIYGGGALPGPQYMLNMHPGVPVNFK